MPIFKHLTLKRFTWSSSFLLSLLSLSDSQLISHLHSQSYNDFLTDHWLPKNTVILFSISSQGKTLMKSIFVFLLYSFAGAGVFKFLEKREKTNKEKATRMLQQLKKNLLYIMTWQTKNLSNLQWQSKKIVSVNKTLDWSCLQAVDLNDSALTTNGEFHFHMIKDKH